MTLAFSTPHLLWLLPLALLPLLPRDRAARPVSSLIPTASLKPTWRIRLHRCQPWLAALILALTVALLAGPVEREISRTTVREGVDLMLALDVSASLGANDIAPSRIAAARSAAADFLANRKDDRVGVILFSGIPLLLSPPVLDKGAVISRMHNVEADRSGSGTAIGDALAAALARLKDSPAREKAIILLTDGSSNRGQITPKAATRAAVALGVRVYAIGFGTTTGAEIPLGADGAPARLPDGSPLIGTLEEAPLQEMARQTGGQYFRATDAGSLRDVYRRIDALEKSPLETRDSIADRPVSAPLKGAIALLLGGELLLFRLWLRCRPASFLFDLAAVCALIALLLPAAPPKATPPDSHGPSLALAIDVSSSMGGQDAAPSRLGRAQEELRALVTGLPNARFSLSLFGGEGVVQTPLTDDRDALLFFIDHLSPGMVSSPGSAPEEGVLTALQTLSTVTGSERAVVLISDGERTVEAPPPRLPTTIPIHIVPIGTAVGATVPTAAGAPRLDRSGRPVVTRLDRERLDLIAATTRGSLLEATPGKPAVTRLVEKWSPPVAPLAPQGVGLWCAFILLILCQSPWSRPRFAPLSFLPALPGLLAVTLVACHNGKEIDPFEVGLKEIKDKDYSAAAVAFGHAADLSVGDEKAAALYNLGTALLAAGEADRAVPAFEQALLILPGETAIRTNLALALRALGDYPPSGSGDGQRNAKDEGEGALSREQAIQLVEAVKPQSFAPTVGETRVRESAGERDW